MSDIINGSRFRDMLDYGIRNLSLYRDYVNGLNVFPVPDGDTGTNMILTLNSGLAGIDGGESNLSAVAKRFSSAVVFGARGNSGVITSQFFKGLSECFLGVGDADCALFTEALTNGVRCAYESITHPVEGTILTVIREATEFVRREIENGSVTSFDELTAKFIEKASEALEQTPNYLPVLKSAGVVDSGGAGIIYVFEGFNKYFRGEDIGVSVDGGSADAYTDYSLFNENTVFDYGYCTDLLIQLTSGKKPFEIEDFKKLISQLGGSIVTSQSNGKVKLHMHTFFPEKVLAACHEYGEFLSLKLENMTVQSYETERARNSFNIKKDANFAVVAVAGDNTMRDMYIKMGADVVLTCSSLCTPSARDFTDAFERSGSSEIIVFPNSKQFILSAEQAGALYKNASVHVIHTRSAAECYSALSIIEYESDDIDSVIKSIEETVKNTYTVSVARAVRDAVYDGTAISLGTFIALSETKLISTGDGLEKTACDAVDRVLEEEDRSIITIFSGAGVTDEQIKAITDHVEKNHVYTETDVIRTECDVYELILSFE